MEKVGQIEIRVIGSDGNNPLTPDNYDIRDIKTMLDNIEDILYPSNKKKRPFITYNIEEGSVKNIFTTSFQAVVQFTAVATLISATNSIDSLEFPTAKAIENIQKQARERNYSFDIKTSESQDVVLRITPLTSFEITSNLWVDAEFYFYGTLTNAGGKKDANIHLDTKEIGSITIEATREFLQEQEMNLLYKKYGVRVKGKQNIATGEIDKTKFELIDLIDYFPAYDEDYLNKLITKASPKFIDIDAEQWLSELRGNYDYE